MSSTTASAISTTTSTLRKRWRAAADGRVGAASFSASVRSVPSRRAAARDRSKRGDDGDEGSEQQDAPVQLAPATRGTLAGFHHASSRTPTPRERQPAAALIDREHETLGDQLPDHAQPPGAKRGADGYLALPRFGARQQEVRHVGAGDQQQETNRAEEQPDRAANAADDFVA